MQAFVNQSMCSRRHCSAKLFALVATSNLCCCCTFPCRLVSDLIEESGGAEKAGEGGGREGAE